MDGAQLPVTENASRTSRNLAPPVVPMAAPMRPATLFSASPSAQAGSAPAAVSKAAPIDWTRHRGRSKPM